VTPARIAVAADSASLNLGLQPRVCRPAAANRLLVTPDVRWPAGDAQHTIRPVSDAADAGGQSWRGLVAIVAHKSRVSADGRPGSLCVLSVEPALADACGR